MMSRRLITTLLPVLFEDEFFMAVAKPAGVDTGDRRDQDVPGVAEILNTVRDSSTRLRVVNRLSRYESGVLLFCKQEDEAERVRLQWKTGGIAQEYLAVIHGPMDSKRLVISAERAEAASNESKALAKKRKTRAGQFKTGQTRPAHLQSNAASNAKSATMLELLGQSDKRSLVRCRARLKSTHELRAQLRSVRLRLIGDSLHETRLSAKRQNRTCLHLSKITFFHPGLKSKVGVTSPAPPMVKNMLEGKYGYERALQAGLVRRLECLTDSSTDVYRLLTGELEDVKGLVAERYGNVLILQVRDPQPVLLESLPALARWYHDILGFQATYVKWFVRNRAALDDHHDAQMHSPKPFFGAAVPEQIMVKEKGLRYAVWPYDGWMLGFFPDQRENRVQVRKLAKDKAVLNLFSYTCSFSVVAAAGGASSVTSVDISGKAMERGKINFEINGLDPEAYAFEQADSSTYCRRAAKRERKFDLIVIDPPTFAHGRTKGKSFSIVHDLADLVAAVLPILSPGGIVMVTTNHRRMSHRGLIEQIRRGAGRRRHKVLATPLLPVDFAINRSHTQTVFVEFV